MFSRRASKRSPHLLALLLGLLCLGLLATPASAQRVKVKGPSKAKVAKVSSSSRTRSTSPASRSVETDLKLKTVKHEGKEYIQTFRVTSKTGLARIMDKNNGFRFFGGGGQYGEALYLFTNRKDANKFVQCNGACDIKRSVIAEILLPKDVFKSVKKSLVLESMDWGKNHTEFNQMRLSSHILYGKWSPSPHMSEPAFEPMNGTAQLAIRQLGAPSILNQSIIREAK